MNSKILVSIIIPIYNSEKYLGACLDSILQQTYENIQIILVDDGSTDSSIQICNHYATSETRIELFSQKNAGASTARNTGIDHAIGEWIVFVDSDDLVLPNYVQNLLNAVLTHSSDMAVSGIRYWNVKTEETWDKKFALVDYHDEFFVKAITEKRLQFIGCPYSKIFNAYIVKHEGIRFNTQMNYAEDCNFMLDYMNHAHSITFIDSIDYVYRLYPGSLSSRKLQYSAECVCKEEMYKRYIEVSKRFPIADLSELKVSVLQYYGRVAKAILGSSDSFVQKRKKLLSLSTEINCRFSNSDVCAYNAYSLHEKVLLGLIERSLPMALLVFDNIYSFLSKIRLNVK